MTHSGRVPVDQRIAVGPVTSVGSLLHRGPRSEPLRRPLGARNASCRRRWDFMVRRGEVAMAGWHGRDRLWDLAERVYPDDPMVPADQARRIRAERRLAALGIAAGRGPGRRASRGRGRPGPMAGRSRAAWPAVLRACGAAITTGPARLRPQADDRAARLRLPARDVQAAAKHRWGYRALPILYRDRLVGKPDAAADRTYGVLRVNAIHQDVPFRQGHHGRRSPGDQDAGALAGPGPAAASGAVAGVRHRRAGMRARLRPAASAAAR